MIYGKLPVVFLSTIVSEKSGSTNEMIATYILDHLDEVSHMGIKEIAKNSHVAISSISRFCKEIGLRDFFELKELLSSSHLYFEKQSDSHSVSQRIDDYSQKINQSIAMVKDTINASQITKLCSDLASFQKVGVFGLMKAGSVAMNLQADLLMLGKQVFTNISYASQMEYILNDNKDDLIIIFSYTGSYFDYENIRSQQKQLMTPKIWMISSEQPSYPAYIDETITFQSLQDQPSHPYQLQFIASLIAQEYAVMLEKNNHE